MQVLFKILDHLQKDFPCVAYDEAGPGGQSSEIDGIVFDDVTLNHTGRIDATIFAATLDEILQGPLLTRPIHGMTNIKKHDIWINYREEENSHIVSMLVARISLKGGEDAIRDS